MKQNYMTVAQFARRHGVSRQMAYQWVKYGRVVAVQIAGHLFIPTGTKRPR